MALAKTGGILPVHAVENAEVGADSYWRASHPKGVMNGHLQVLASDGPAWQLREAVPRNEAMTDPSWRLTRPNEPTIRQFQAMSLDAPAWHSSDAADAPNPVESMARAWA
jgi:hypothetical protein